MSEPRGVTARLPGREIRDWDDFHSASARVFGFPDFYGRNMNAWIDCLTYVRADDGMSRFVLAPGETLQIELGGAAELRKRAPEIVSALEDAVRFVNERAVANGERPVLALIYLE